MFRHAVTIMRFFPPVMLATLLLGWGIQRGLDPESVHAQNPLPPQSEGNDSTSLAWTEPYAEALEAQTDLVLTTQPLTATLTRVELAQWLAEFFGYIPDRTQAQIISDMTVDTPDYWTAQAVIQSGAMRLYDSNEFRPQGDMTKLEALAILVRALQVPPPTEAEVNSWMSLYSDAADVPEVGRPLVAMAGQARLIVNVPDPEQLTPNLILRRGEGIVLLHQVLVYRQRLPALDPPVAQLSPPGVAAAPAQTDTALAGDALPEIYAVQVNPDAGTVPAGMPVTVTAQATPGGQAIIDIGTIQGISMREIQPGLYQGSYTVQATDGVQSPDVGVQLTLAGRSTRLQKRQPQLVLGNAAPPPIDSPVLTDPGAGTPFPQPQATPPIALQPQPPSPTVPSAVAVPEGDYPEFSYVRIQPERDLQEGDIVTLNLWGDTGATARFDFGSLATDQPLREIKTNLYEGTYVVQPDDQATNPVVKILLTRNGLTTQHAEIFPFRIDGNQGTRSTIQPNPSSFQEQVQINSVSTNAASRRLQYGEILTVTMQGDQGGTATFEIRNVTPPIPMRQVSPGVYEGQVQIGENTPAIDNGALQVTLERNGQRATRTLESPVMIGP